MELILKMYRTRNMWNFLPTLILLLSWMTTVAAAETIVPLKVRGSQFVDAEGRIHRLWGVNSVSFYPDHKLAEKVAENFARLGINCVRPHHMLRKSTDWNPKLPGGGLLLYQEDSTTPDREAYDRFFYYTNELRKRGIYLLLSLGDTRLYLPDDVKIIDGGKEDNARWRKSIEELNSRPWQESHDVKKLLPLIDERAARLYETYIDRLMGTVNPYSGKRFADDPQVLTVELLNEFSLEYSIICRNRFPEYQKERFQTEWARFAKSRGLPAGDIFELREPTAVQARGEFLQKLEKRFIDRMTAKLRTLGYQGAVLYSNLWRGEKASLLAAEKNDSIEEHAYVDPRIGNLQNFIYDKAAARIAGKPYLLGELNISEYGDDLENQKKKRSLLPLQIAAYGSLHDWSGVVWFAWSHGGSAVGRDGWAAKPSRRAELGNMVCDEMMLDHMRTTSLIFRNQLLKKSVSPLSYRISADRYEADYHSLIRNVCPFPPGTQFVHGISRRINPDAAADAAAEKFIASGKGWGDVILSDTGEIRVDRREKNLVVTAEKVNAFGGDVPEGGVRLPHVSPELPAGTFAVVAMVSADGKALDASGKIIISRTLTDAAGRELPGCAMLLTRLAQGGWRATVTRPRDAAGRQLRLENRGDGNYQLEAAEWHELELSR